MKYTKKYKATELKTCKTSRVSEILYIKATWCLSVCLCGQKLGSAWKILPVTARSLWSVLGGGARESPVKHGAGGGASRGGASMSRGGGTGGEGPGGGCQHGRGGGHGRGRIGRGEELDRCIMHRVHIKIRPD